MCWPQEMMGKKVDPCLLENTKLRDHKAFKFPEKELKWRFCIPLKVKQTSSQLTIQNLTFKVQWITYMHCIRMCKLLFEVKHQMLLLTSALKCHMTISIFYYLQKKTFCYLNSYSWLITHPGSNCVYLVISLIFIFWSVKYAYGFKAKYKWL